MDQNGIALVLHEIATLLEIQGENRFKVRAFSNAARAVVHAEDWAGLVGRGEFETLEGIGPATARVIRELHEQGRSRYYEELRERTPAGLLEVLAVPRLGASKVRILHERLGVGSLDDLEREANDGRIAALPGFGERTQSQILKGIEQVRRNAGRRRYAEALELGDRLRAFIAAQADVTRAELAGELRRSCETVGGVVVVAETMNAAAVRAAVQTLPGLRDTDPDSPIITGRLGDGVELRIVLVPPERYAATLQVETGSVEHLNGLRTRARELGLSLEPWGVMRSGVLIPMADERGIYETLGLAWTPPELRETGVEIEAARMGRLPNLVAYDDLRGCFHCHTTWSDGRASVEEMAEAALERGWRYLGIADHSQYAGYAGGLSPDEIIAQHVQIEAWNVRHGTKLWLFKGIEADILPDGRLDYEDRPDLLERFDYVIASAHSGFNLPVEAQTQRFLRVIENPFITFLGHLTGRLLLSRAGLAMDLDAVLHAVARRGIGIEINADPNRMDMDWRQWPAAKALGVRTAINPDAHSVAQLDYVHNGIAIARKGWLESGDVVNCGTLTQVRKFFRATRR